jgi:hypothetical protein
MIQLLGGLIGGILKPIADLGSQWMSIRAAKTQAKIAIQDRIATGDIDYNIAAQKGAMASWKDEWLTVWTTLVVTALFFPQTQGYVANGLRVLQDATPDWFAYCFVGMYVAVFGLKSWKMVRNGG